MSVVFNSFDVIEIDGIAAGNIVDVISNHAPRRAEVLAAFGVYVAAINAEKATLTTDLATANADKTSLTSQVETLESQLQEVTESKDVLFVRKQAVDHDLAEAEVKIAWLESIRTYDPNVIKSEAFYNRITKDELFALGTLAVSDQTAKGILELLGAYKANAWQVILNDPQVVGAMQYLTALGTLGEGRVTEITRPASREEAYIQA